MQIELNDREQGVVVAALELFRKVKQEAIQAGPIPVTPMNEYDLLSSPHALMHTLTLLSRLLKQPIEHFANPNPSQTLPQAKDAPGGN